MNFIELRGDMRIEGYPDVSIFIIISRIIKVKEIIIFHLDTDCNQQCRPDQKSRPR
jgi:hypothetical protein